MASLITPPGILSFPHLFIPKPVATGQEPRFSLNLIFDVERQKAPEYQALRKAVFEAIGAEWGIDKARDTAFVRKLRLPFRDGAERKQTGYDAPGCKFISAWSKSKPGVVNGQNQPILVASDVWPGQTARCSVTVFTYSNSGNTGVSFGLNNVQVMRTDGVRLDGRKRPDEEFDPVEADAASGAPLSDDEDVPF